MRDFSIFCKGNFVGIFRDYDERGAISQAYMAVGGASKYSGASYDDFVAIRLGLL